MFKSRIVCCVTATLLALSAGVTADPAQAVRRFEALGGRIRFGGDGNAILLHLESTSVADDDLELLTHLPHLRRLYLANTRITDHGLRFVSQLTHLRRLSLWRTPVTDEGIRHLLKLQHLEVVDLHATRITTAGVQQLARLQKLTLLNASRSNLSGEFIFSFSGLKYLDLSGNQLSGFAARDWRPQCRVNLTGNAVSLSGLASTFSRARDISFRAAYGSRWIDPDAPVLTLGPLETLDLTELPRFRQLDRLRFHGTALSRHELAAIPAHRSVRDVRFESCRFPDGLSGLAGARRWTHLSFRGSPIKDRELSHLANIKELAELDLTDTSISGDGLSAFEDHPRLRTLHLDGQQLSDACIDFLASFPRVLDLSVKDSGIDDHKLERLCQNHHLRLLKLDGCPITDASVYWLASLNDARRISLRRTPLSQSAGLSLIPELPRARNLSFDFVDLKLKTVDVNKRAALRDVVMKFHQPWRDGAQHLAEFPFRHVEIEGLDDQGVLQLNKLSRISSLSIRSQQLSDRGLRELRLPDSVRRVTLDCPLTPASLDSISLWTHIDTLHLPQAPDTAVRLLPELRLSRLETNRIRMLVHWKPPVTLQVKVGKLQSTPFRGFRFLTSLPPSTSLTYWDYGYVPPRYRLGPELADLAELNDVTSLDVSSLRVAPSAGAALAKLTHLESLKLGPLTAEQLRHVSGLRKLSSLAVSVDSDEEHALAPLASLHNLQHLQLGGRPAGASGEPLTHLTKLESLDVTGIHDIDHLVPAIGGLGQLQHLMLRRVGNVSLPAIGKLRELRSLQITTPYEPPITDKGLESLGTLAHLNELSIHGEFDQSGTQHLLRLKHLKKLTLGHLMTPIALEPIGRLTQLEDLTLSGNLNRESFKYLSSLKSLVRLDLTVSPESLEGLIHLETLPRLRTVRVFEAAIPAVVQEKLSGVRFEYSGQ